MSNENPSYYEVKVKERYEGAYHKEMDGYSYILWVDGPITNVLAKHQNEEEAWETAFCARLLRHRRGI